MRHHYRPNHTYSSFKSHKNTQLTKDQTSPRSSSFHHKIVKPPLFASADPSNPEIYFNKLKRKSYLKNVIDNYFSTPIPQSKL